ncbi:hypothetical protein V8F06_005614 [Rhypophila decipiens]
MSRLWLYDSIILLLNIFIELAGCFTITNQVWDVSSRGMMPAVAYVLLNSYNLVLSGIYFVKRPIITLSSFHCVSRTALQRTRSVSLNPYLIIFHALSPHTLVYNTCVRATLVICSIPLNQRLECQVYPPKFIPSYIARHVRKKEDML